MKPGRIAGVGLAAALLALAVPGTAAGAETLRVGEAVARDCAERLPAGTPGTAQRTFTAAEAGLLTATLSGGPAGDWDLALFRAGSARPAFASTAFGSDERAEAWLGAGDEVVAQACRRAGGPAVPLDFGLFPLSELPSIPDERISLESVAISGPADAERLERLGLDVTHDVSETSATVATYSDAERALLVANGFEATTLIADLPAADDADRRAERADARAAKRSGSSLPSGRTSYRQYSDYTSEMKDLAEAHPQIAREVTIGTSLEGRPIQGLEIAGNVNAAGDGRPAYVNMGLHHAREWPSGEFPMELAIDLVERHANGNNRIRDLLGDVRVFIFPVVNPDGFVASRGHGTDALDDDPNGHITEALADQNAYKRKNCRPQLLSEDPVAVNPADAAIPCSARTGSGVDLNRNYGAYWGGPGSGGFDQQATQIYRGPAPFSEPESQAVHAFSAGIHPTVFITNHTFVTEGVFLRQPGFTNVVTTTPDEAAMRHLGDAMGAATGWASRLAWTLGQITGATEDWNYFSQGTYGYTPEARAVNFHPNYATAVVKEYVGDAQHAGEGVREAFVIAGERAGRPAHHSIVTGSAPAAATLRLRKEFQTPTCVGGCNTPSRFVADVLDTTLNVPGDGSYRWHVTPSGRPLHQAETWTMSCELPGDGPVSVEVPVDRGEAVTVDWNAACKTAFTPPSPPTCGGEVATIIGTPGHDRGPNKLLGTAGEDVILGRGGDDVIKGRGEDDIICGGGGADKLRGHSGFDLLYGNRGRDHLIGGADFDHLRGGKGKDSCRDDGVDFLKGCNRKG